MSFHADQARGHVGEPCLHLATGSFLPQHDRAALIETHNVERVLADIHSNNGNRRAELLRHSVLLDFGAPGKLRLPAGQEHGRTIPLADAAILIRDHASKQHLVYKKAPPGRRG